MILGFALSDTSNKYFMFREKQNMFVIFENIFILLLTINNFKTLTINKFQKKCC